MKQITYLIFSIFLILLNSINTKAQTNKIALSIYNKLGFKASIKEFQSDKDISIENMIRIANSHRLNHETAEAELWYSKVIDHTKEPEIFLYYAQALQSNKKFDLAKKYFLQYDKMVENNELDTRGKSQAEAIDNIELFNNSGATVSNVSTLNSSKVDFAPTYLNDQIIFVSNRDNNELKSKLNDFWTDDNYMTLYQSTVNNDGTLSQPEIFSEKFTTKFHEGPLVFNKNGDQVFFTKSDFYKGNRRNNKEGVMKLEIYHSSKKGDEWTKPKSLNINTLDYEEAHPAISPNGKKLYFSSDRKGGFGGMDLYVSEYQDGKWSTPQNLGRDVNTKGNEVFPFIATDGTLYFASNGWGGLGGLDIFKSTTNEVGTFVTNENLGAPINSTKDDFSMVINLDSKSGYFSSAREEGMGKDDIYRFELNDVEENNFTLYAKENNSDKLLSYLYISIENDKNLNPILRTTSEDGQTSLNLKKGIIYTLTAKKGGYKTYTKKIGSTDISDHKSGYCIYLEPEILVKIEGFVSNKSIEKALPNASVILLNQCTKEEKRITTDTNGYFNFSGIDCTCDYILKGEKAEFIKGTYLASMDDLLSSNNNKISISLELEPIANKVDKSTPIGLKSHEVAINDSKSNTDNSNTINTSSEENINYSPTSNKNKLLDDAVVEVHLIYYDFDKADIRKDASVELDKVVSLLNKYPTMNIELGSHTDARGSDSYNNKLSQQRASSVVAYLVSKGINKNRLYVKSYGESQLSSNCIDHIDGCTEKDHQYNRRTEIRILKIDTKTYR